MAEKILKKQSVNKIGRVFTMLFNRAVMYDMNHPFTTKSMRDFFKLMTDELDSISPIVIILHQDQVLIEDEPLDSRINVAKIVIHFKKTEIQSIQFRQGMEREEMEHFFRTIINTLTYPDVEHMQQELTSQGVRHLKLNHVFFQKVTVDDTIVGKKMIGAIPEAREENRKEKLKTELLDLLSGGLAINDLGKSFSVTDFFGDSEKLLEISAHHGGGSDSQSTGDEGPVLIDSIGKIKSELDKAAVDLSGSKLHELAASVVKMRADILNGIYEKKKNGIAFYEEELLMSKTNELADNVILNLVREEYKQGATSIKRLSQVLRRLIPDNDELHRFLPKLKQTLLIEGMSLDDFLELTEDLESELTSQNVSLAIKESAEEIGVSGEALLKEFTSNPNEAAELIYLASELRKETGDEKALTGVLVEYIERVGTKIALDSDDVQNDDGSAHLKSVVSGVQSEIVEKLKKKEMDPQVINTVSAQLDDRMDSLISKLEKRLENNGSNSGTWDHETTSLMKIFEENISDTKTFKELLVKLRDQHTNQTTGELNNEKLEAAVRQVVEEAESSDQIDEPKKTAQALPKGIHNRKSILYFIERQIALASRYKTPFSAVTFSILKAIPQQKFAAGTVKHDDITASVLSEMLQLVRDSDLIGVLDKKKIINLLPMTDEDEAKLAMRRLMKRIHSNLFKVNGISIEVKFAGSVTNFNKSETPDLKQFVSKAEKDIIEVVQRLKNLQNLY